ncbi:MAG: prepilin-type N-terminal cleavage/methylation domain-containing protein [Candidatus Gracilibacteria bacterium]|nr:prepilin-type N-terminal cleavage/methylation domain-containing protein [Candidatus Gracilibacteria bacterium]
MKKHKQAFTLVELIVVITVLAILATIAFISLSGYSQDARNSVRASDVKNIDKSLQLYLIKNRIYPEPENPQTVSYSGETVYLQGTFGDSPYKEVGNLSDIPLDPLTNEQYIYSITAKKNEYEILVIYEGVIVMTTPQPSPYQGEGVATNISIPLPMGELRGGLISQTQAANESYKPKVTGTYNKIYVKTTNYYIPLPSIINAEVSGTGIILDETNIKSQIVTNGTNLPQIGTSITQSTGAIANLNLSVYTGGKITLTSTDDQKVALAQKIQEAYSGSDLQSQAIYSNILSKTTINQLVALIDSIVLGNGANIITSTNDSSTSSTTCDFSGDFKFDGTCYFGD